MVNYEKAFEICQDFKAKLKEVVGDSYIFPRCELLIQTLENQFKFMAEQTVGMVQTKQEPKPTQKQPAEKRSREEYIQDVEKLRKVFLDHTDKEIIDGWERLEILGVGRLVGIDVDVTSKVNIALIKKIKEKILQNEINKQQTENTVKNATNEI